MLKVIKMDLYRLLKSRIGWILLILLFAATAVSMHTQHSDYEFLRSTPQYAEVYQDRFPLVQMKSGIEGVDTYYLFSHLMQVDIGYAASFLIVLFSVLFAGAENSSGFIKNIAGQPSIRHRTVLSKCLTVAVFCALALTVVGFAVLLGEQIFFGYICLSMYSIPDMLLFGLTQFLLHSALGIVAVCLSQVIKNQAISTAVGAMLSIGAARLLTDQLDDFFQISRFSFTSLLLTVNRAVLPVAYDGGIYWHAWMIGMIFIATGTVVSVLSMRRRDI